MRQSRWFSVRRIGLLGLPILLGVGAFALLLAGAPARPVHAAAPLAAAPLAPAGCDNDPFEVNNVYTQAASLDLPVVIYKAYICDVPTPDDKDWYRLDLAAGQSISVFLHFTHAFGDLDMTLFASDGSTYVTGSSGEADNEMFSYATGPAGTYYLMVEGFLGSQNTYDLSITGGCYARAVTDFFSADAQAVRDAVEEASPGSTVKIAGYCPGTVLEDGTTQTVLVTKTLTLAGGYAPNNWITPHPLTQPTTLDAMGGGTVISSTSALTLRDFTVQHGLADNGGGLYTIEPAVLNAMVFLSNTATVGGGGAYIEAAASVTNTVFDANLAVNGAGGGLTALYASIEGGFFIENEAGSAGGGLFAPNGGSIVSTTFDSNQAASEGGGAWLGNESTVTDSGFQSNQAGDGAGLYANGPLLLTGSSFAFNEAAGFGGGLAVYDRATLMDVGFINNQARFGGGVGAQAPVTLNDVTFLNNTAVLAGGGMLAGDSVHITAGAFRGNQASLAGGALAQTYDPLTAQQAPAGFGSPGEIENSVFSGNSAASGLDLSLMAPLTNTIRHVTFVGLGHPLTASVVISNGVLTLRNSLLSGYALALKRTGGSASEDYNLFFGGGGAVASYLNGAVTSGGHSFVADPLLVDAAGGNDHLTFLSPARDRGLELGVTTDADGDPRPIGPRPDIGYDEIVYWRLALPAVVR